MEGYFPISDYCVLAQVDRDTAYHRAIRGTVDSFRNKNGRLYIYHSQNNINIPDNFIPLTTYAKKQKKSYSAIHRAMSAGEFKSKDIVVLPLTIMNGSSRSKIFINPDAERAKRTYEMRARAKRPEGYLTANEWREKYHVTKSNFNQMIISDRIETIKVGAYRYVKETQQLPEDKRRGRHDH